MQIIPEVREAQTHHKLTNGTGVPVCDRRRSREIVATCIHRLVVGVGIQQRRGLVGHHFLEDRHDRLALGEGVRRIGEGDVPEGGELTMKARIELNKRRCHVAIEIAVSDLQPSSIRGKAGLSPR